MQNILLDLRTAELVHIDLGVAFDLGKVLKTPEIVPFRFDDEGRVRALVTSGL